MLTSTFLALSEIVTETKNIFQSLFPPKSSISALTIRSSFPSGMSMIGKANSINKIIQTGVGTATGAVGILWVSEVSLDGLCGLCTYVNRWESTDLAFPSGSPRHLWYNFGQVPIHKPFLSFSILWGLLYSLSHAAGKFYRLLNVGRTTRLDRSQLHLHPRYLMGKAVY